MYNGEVTVSSYQFVIFLGDHPEGSTAGLSGLTASRSPRGVARARTLSDGDCYAKNTLLNPDRVGLAENDSIVIADGTVTITLPPVSWTVVALR